MADTSSTEVAFSFTEAQLASLGAHLGDLQDTAAFLHEVERIIDLEIWSARNDSYGIPTTGVAADRLSAIERACACLIQDLGACDLDLRGAVSRGQVASKDWASTMLVEAASVIDENGEEWEGYSGYISDTLFSVQTLGALAHSARDRLGKPKRGDVSAYELRKQNFEESIVGQYYLKFGRYPAKTNGGAFHEAMKIFYKCAEFSHSNSFQRICKAISRYTNNAGNDSIPEILRPNPKPHPRSRKVE